MDDSDGVSALSSETETETSSSETETWPFETETTPSETETFKIRDQDRDRDPIFILSNIFLHKKHHFFTENISSTRKTSFFHWGYWNLPPTECFFHASIFICFFFRSCGLDRVVSSETETFEPRDRDETETFERRDRDETETHKIRSRDRSRDETRSRDLHHW